MTNGWGVRHKKKSISHGKLRKKVAAKKTAKKTKRRKKK
jgi:hypothetical protein